MKKPFLLAASLVLVVIAAAGVIWLRQPPLIPKAVSKQVDFVLFYPDPKADSTISLTKNSFKYDRSSQVLSFIAGFQGRSITFSEQTSPQQFADIPQYYPSFIDKLNGYASFENAIGRVDLTRPAEVKSQTAIMNSKGTLVFARDNGKDMNGASWKRLFNSLSYLQPR